MSMPGGPSTEPEVRAALRHGSPRRDRSAHRWVLPVIALGGVIGAEARHALELAWPAEPSAIPWAILAVNLSGCFLIGVLMVQLVEFGPAHPLLRPFLGVGVLGGYTTFSTYAVQSRNLWASGHVGTAALYLAITPALALAAASGGVFLARSLRRVHTLISRRKAPR